MTVIAGRYRLVRELGRGGMGRVWEAADEVLHRGVAVKEVLLPADLDADERSRLCRRAVREARAAGMLDHASIIAVHDVLIEDGRPWIVMELVDGRSLRDALPVPPHEAARIGASVLDALRTAHRAGVVHRDVTPGNVLLGSDGRVVLTDFGIADLDGDPALTRTGTVIGSPGYIAPERLDGREVDGRSDLFSLGATLYTAVEGRPPFGRESDAATFAATLTEPPPRPRRAGRLRPLLAGLLRKDPAERPEVEQVAATLGTVSAGRGRWRVRGAPVPELTWLGAVAVPAAVFLLPAYVTEPHGEALYRHDFRPCPLRVGSLTFEVNGFNVEDDLHECSDGNATIRWYEGYVEAYGKPVSLRHSSVRLAHRWLRFLSVHNVPEDEEYPLDIEERDDIDRPTVVTDRYRARRPRPLDGIADEAYVREVRDGGDLMEVEITFRDSNLVISVAHDGDDARRAARETALDVLAELRKRR